MKSFLLLALFSSLAAAPVDESAVPPHTPGDPLLASDGSKITSAMEWKTKRRPELLEMMRREMYGTDPGRPSKMRFEIFDRDPEALGGKAVREQITIFFTGEPTGPKMDLLIYRPNKPGPRCPAILGLNFWGNHAIHHDPGIRLNKNWVENTPFLQPSGVVDNRATEAARGTNASQWPVEKIIARGYALVTAYRGDIARDDPAEAFKGNVLAAFPELQGRGDNFSLIGAWAWSLSRALDCLETHPGIDGKRVAVFGWSRLGKAALWAGASDERFGMVFPHQSGAGGAALSKRIFGEDVDRLAHVFPHWFCGNFAKYSRNESALPFDQHEVIALVAPRPLCLGNAVGDVNADPKGEFLAAKAAEAIYQLLGAEGLPAETWPAPDAPSFGGIGYHLRPGGHQVTEVDWDRYLAFADKHWGTQ